MAEGAGFVLGKLIRPWYSPEIQAIEMLVYVLPDKRNTTAAIKMLKMWEQTAKQRGAVLACVGTTTGYRTDAVTKLYTRMGYKSTGASFRKEL